MAEATSSASRATSSIDLIERAAAGRPPPIDRMPRPSFKRMVEMRDNARLATWGWLPVDRRGPYPAILFRTPYREDLLGWMRMDPLRYRDAGYAVVFQLIRGIGESEGAFEFANPLDRSDGFDTIEWVAAQPWCTGAVGMDGSSYVGMTQIAAAIEQPPSLRCIVPAVVSSDFFNDVPRYGGIVSRQHTLGWTQFTYKDSLADLTPGLWGAQAFLANPAAWPLLLSRPALAAADGVLEHDALAHYREVLTRETFDDWWAARTFSPSDYARVAVPTMVVTGLFDGSMGSQILWRMLEEHAPAEVERRLVIGPWDHGQAYVGGAAYGPYRFEDLDGFDLQSARLAFFDRHLRGEGAGPRLAGRVSSYLLGADRWLGMAAYPDPAVSLCPLYLASDGPANLRGNGRLVELPRASDAADAFEVDPELPFVPVGRSLDPKLALDLRETERQEDVLVYTGEPLAAPLTLHGEFAVELHLSADVPDCDIVCWLARVPPDGRTTQLSVGMLRARYRHGFDRTVLLTPGEPVAVRVAMAHVGITLAPGDRLRLLIGGTLFPLLDPNPHDGGPTATAAAVRRARQVIHHGVAHPSRVLLPAREEES